ncbi:anti-sigma factor family protein [Planctomycetota bacterium]
MTHPSNEEWMAYLYGEVQSPQKAELDAHLRQCDQCKSSVTQWRTVMDELDTWQLPQERSLTQKISRHARTMIRWAAAAVLLIVAGYTAGWISAGRSLDIERLRKDLEVSLRPSLQAAVYRDVSEQMKDDWNLTLASHNTRFQKEFEDFKEQINEQRHIDLTEFAAKTLSVSGAVTNQLLRELIYEIQTTQMQDRHRFAAALQQIELNRVRDNNWAKNSLQNLALRTEDVLLRTEQDASSLFSDPNQTIPNPDAREDRNILERKE